MTPDQLAFTFAHLDTLLNVPTYDPLLFGSDTDPTYALSSHSTQLHKTFRQVKSFWTDIQSDDIQLMAMHSDVLLDPARIARTIAFLADSPITPAIQQEADTVAAFMQDDAEFLAQPALDAERLRVLRRGGPRPPHPGHPRQAGLR